MMKSKKTAVFAALALGGALLLTGCGGDQKQAAKEKTFTFATMAYGLSNENVGTNPHDTYVGWSTLRLAAAA